MKILRVIQVLIFGAAVLFTDAEKNLSPELVSTEESLGDSAINLNDGEVISSNFPSNPVMLSSSFSSYISSSYGDEEPISQSQQLQTRTVLSEMKDDQETPSVFPLPIDIQPSTAEPEDGWSSEGIQPLEDVGPSSVASNTEIAEDRMGYIEDFENDAEIDYSQIHLVDRRHKLRSELSRISKDTRQSNPSIDHLISGLVNLIGGDIKTDRRRPLPPPPRFHVRRPPRLPIQPRPSLIKIPLFTTSSRVNNRGPTNFNGVRPGVNFGVSAKPNKPIQTPSIYFSTRQKPNRWEWTNFGDFTSEITEATTEVLTTTETTISSLPTQYVKLEPSSVRPSLTSTHSDVIEASTVSIIETFSSIPSSVEATAELTVNVEDDFSSMETEKTSSTPEINTSSTTKTEKTSFTPEINTSSTITTSPITSEIVSIVPIETPTQNQNRKPSSIDESSETSVFSPMVQSSTKTVDTEVAPKETKSTEIDTSVPLTNTPIVPITTVESEVYITDNYLLPSASFTNWEPIEVVSESTPPTDSSTTVPKVSVMTAPNVVDIKATNSNSDQISQLQPSTVSEITEITNTYVPTKPRPTPPLRPKQPPTKPNFTTTTRPKTEPNSGKGEYSIERLSDRNTGAKFPTLQRLPPAYKPKKTKRPPVRPTLSRPSAIGRPTVIPVDLENFRGNNFNLPPGFERFPGNRPSGTRVSGNPLNFGNKNGLRPVRPRPSRPRPPLIFKPNLKPSRIDTCIVGEDSTCDHTLNEQCRIEGSVSSCICRPGFARVGSRGSCIPIVSLVASIKIDKYGPRRISFSKKLLDHGSEQYILLKEEANKAVNTIFKYTKFRGMFYGSNINKFYSIGGKVYANATVLLKKTPEMQTESIRHGLQKELNNVISSRNQRLGDSVLYVEGLLKPVPGVQDLNECAFSDLNDCGENSICNNKFGTFDCKCKDGYLDKNPDDPLKNGRYCSTCSPKFCNNHGDCVVNNGKQECICKGSYIGAKCDIDAEVLGVALGVSLAAVIIIILTLVCLCSWSRRWKEEQQKIDRVSARTSQSSGNTFTYIDKSGKAGGSVYHIDDRSRWPDSINNYYTSDPMMNHQANNHPIYNTGLYPKMPPNGSQPLAQNSPHIDNPYHVPRPRSRASHAGSGIYYDSDYPRDIYHKPNQRNSGYAIPLRPMRS